MMAEETKAEETKAEVNRFGFEVGKTLSFEEQRDFQAKLQAERELDAGIVAALSQVDHADNASWTKTGLVEMKAVEALLGDAAITREDIERVAPDFKRKK